MDIPCAPILADITVDGRAIKAVAQPTKQAFLYVFNRETGEPVWPIEERPVPKGRRARRVVFADAAVSHEAAGLRSAGPARSTTSSTSRRSCAPRRSQLVSKYKIGPIFTPPVVSKADGPLATLAMATAGGGTNWPGGSFDPETQILYVSSSKTVSQLGLVPPADPKKNDMAYVQGNAATGMRDRAWRRERAATRRRLRHRQLKEAARASRFAGCRS